MQKSKRYYCHASFIYVSFAHVKCTDQLPYQPNLRADEFSNDNAIYTVLRYALIYNSNYPFLIKIVALL